VPGVKIVDLYRLIRSTYNGMPILIESFSAVESASVRSLPTPGGDGKKALSEMAAGKGVIVSESFQSKFGKDANDTIELATPAGLIGFKVLGVYIDYSSDIGSVLIDRGLYKKFWQDELVDAFDIWLEPGADQSVVIEKIKERVGGAHHGAIVRG
jgi:putative ABC transport system permease protein